MHDSAVRIVSPTLSLELTSSRPLVVSLRWKPRQHWHVALTIVTVATGDGRGGKICPTVYVISDVCTADVSDSRNE